MQNNLLKSGSFLFFVFSFACAYSQDSLHMENTNVLSGVIVDGDTIFLASIEEVYIFPRHRFSSRRDMRRYERLIRNVKRAYPYAIIASETLEDIAMHTVSMKNEKERKKYIKEREKELFDKYEDELKKLTITQGKILIKLIDRETGDTSYDLVKELRGSFSAFFWQTLARIFGSNLKSEFDPHGEDKLLNEIVILIEAGQL